MGKQQRQNSQNNRNLSTFAPVSVRVSTARFDFVAVSADIDLSGHSLLETVQIITNNFVQFSSSRISEPCQKP